MKITELSNNYNIRFLNEDDIPIIYDLMKENDIYFKYCPPFPSYLSIKEDMKALPNNKTYDDKYYIGYFKDNELICVMDLIDNYPYNKCAFIGLFMICKKYQNKNIGSSIINDLITYLSKEKYQEIRLGYVKDNNQAKSFWLKNNFLPTGIIAHEEKYDVVVMQRLL